jgi:uncharacterized delta-60 repeat protein
VVEITYNYQPSRSLIVDIFRKDYTIENNDGNMGVIDNTVVFTTETGSGFSKYTFVVETIGKAYSFEYRISGTTFIPTPTPTPSVTPTMTPTPSVTPTMTPTPSFTPTMTPTPSPEPDICYGSGTGLNTRTIFINKLGNKTYITGNFITYNGISVPRGILRLNLNGSIDSSYNVGTGFSSTTAGGRQSIFQSNGKLLVARGESTSFNGTSITYTSIIRVNSDGSLDTSYDSPALDLVSPIDIDTSDRLYSIVAVADPFRRVIRRFNSNGSLDISFNSSNLGFNGVVRDIFVQSDGKILVGGDFTTFGGVTYNRIIRLNSDGTVDGTFNIGTGFNRGVYSLGQDLDGKILVGSIGAFATTYNGISVPGGIIRLNTDGSRDISFDTGTGINGTVRKIKVLSDGKIFVGGQYSTVNSVSNISLVKLNSDGSRDTSFNVGVSFSSFNRDVVDFVTEIYDKIVVVGQFEEYQNIVVNNIVRIKSNGLIDNC